MRRLNSPRHGSFVLPLAVLTSISLAACPVRLLAAEDGFKAKLSESMQKSERAVKILRQQIIESQNAPFLPDLYVQLGDLLSQRALTLYYIQMERDGKLAPSAGTSAESSQPVVAATREAVDVYQTVLHDFPTYPKRAEVAYKLAVSFKSIDDVPKFIGVATKLIKDFPGTEEAMRANILLGRHFMDRKLFDEAYALLAGIAASKYPYERNLARHWIGLIYLGQEKYPAALKEFELVVSDPELKEQANPYEIRQAAGAPKSDLRREALVDSIRAYTMVHEKDPDPIGYYSKLCPTEAYFQEVMEKLALRYVLLKKYAESVKILRHVSERNPDPQKVINVYREVLLMIPMDQRLALPVEEMRFITGKFAAWKAYFEVPPKAYVDAYGFFEKQVRDIATRNHDLAKSATDPLKKKAELDQAREYYLLYLGFFERNLNAVKMATDLADVYYLQNRFAESGDYYIRIFREEFGKTSERKALIENAIMALQKDKSEGLYEKTRAKGLLIKAITSYQAFSPKLRNDPKLELLRLKTEYEQGFLPETLDSLFVFIQKNRNASQAVDAGDLILDYYNTRNDFTGLERATDKLSALKLGNPAFTAKLARLKVQAKSKVVQEKVRKIAGYDEFSQGKSYLAAAMQSDDADLKNAVLQEALAKSKREHDLATFLKAAALMAKKETDPKKRAGIRRSIAQELMKVGRFYKAIALLNEAAQTQTGDAAADAHLAGDILNATLSLHDPDSLREAFHGSAYSRSSPELQARARALVGDVLDSREELSSSTVDGLWLTNPTDEVLLSFFKARRKSSPLGRARIMAELDGRCGAGSGSHAALCAWRTLASLEGAASGALSKLASATTDLKALEGNASSFMAALQKYQAVEGASDPQLDTVVSIRAQALYAGFAGYLRRVAAANPDLRDQLIQKAAESESSGKIYAQKCQTLVNRAPVPNPALKFCAKPAGAPFESLLSWSAARGEAAPARQDPGGETIANGERSIFASDSDAETLLRQASEFYRLGAYRHAAALSTFGMGSHADRGPDFKALLGCALVKVGFVSEATFHLNTASDYQGLKAGCLASLREMRLQ